MAGTTAQVFYPTTGTIDQTLTGAGTVRLLDTTALGAANNTTTLSYTAAQTQTVVPFAASGSAGDTRVNNGWVFNNTTGTYALNSTSSAQRVIPAGTWTFAGSLTFTAPALLATGSATVQVGVYRVATGGGTRTLLFSSNFAASTWTAAQTNNISVTSASQPQYTLGDGEVLLIGYTIASADTKNTLNQSTTSVIKFIVGGANGAAVTVPTPGVRTQYNNPVSDSVTTSESLTRVASFPRAITETLTTSETPTRAAVYNRAISDATTVTDAVTRAANHPRSLTDTYTTTDVVARQVVAPRTTTETLTTSDSPTRAYVGSRSITDTTSVSDVVARALIYGRFMYEYPPGVQPDYRVDFPTKHIAGFVRNSDGTVFYGGALMQLIRDSDNKVVQTTTSSTIDGSYSFVRDTYDPNTYHVAAFYPSAPEQGVTQTGLVPV